MDRRGLRAIVVLAAAALVTSILVVADERVGGPTTATGSGGPDSLAGPTTFAAIGPTAIPGSNLWDEILAPPTPGPTKKPDDRSEPAPTPKPKPRTDPIFMPGRTPNPTPRPDPTPKPAPCSLFPSDNVWNQRVDDLPVDSKSDTYIDSIGLDKALHPDFSSLAWNGGKGYGIPFNKVSSSTPTYHVSFDYDDESDPGPYPIPSNPRIEGGSDAHVLLWDTQGCDLYEIIAADKSGGHW